MEYKVIGWSTYDDSDFRDLPHDGYTPEVFDAVLENVKENGYLFCGEDQQERYNCCPVLNNYRKACYSRRGFAHIMAVAHGEMGDYDYARYMESCSVLSKCKVFPKSRPFDESGIEYNDYCLRERTMEIERDLYDRMKKIFIPEGTLVDGVPVPKIHGLSAFLMPVDYPQEGVYWPSDQLRLTCKDALPLSCSIKRIIAVTDKTDLDEYVAWLKKSDPSKRTVDKNLLHDALEKGKTLILEVN